MNLLLALDHSSCSAAAIDAVCQRYRAENTDVRVLHVVEWPRDLPTELTFAEGPSAAKAVMQVHDELRTAGRELLERASNLLRAAGFRATTVIVEGDPRRQILQAASDWSADMIVLGSHGRKGIDRFLLGSVSEQVLRHATCSVSIVREPHPNEVKAPAA